MYAPVKCRSQRLPFTHFKLHRVFTTYWFLSSKLETRFRVTVLSFLCSAFRHSYSAFGLYYFITVQSLLLPFTAITRDETLAVIIITQCPIGRHIRRRGCPLLLHSFPTSFFGVTMSPRLKQVFTCHGTWQKCVFRLQPRRTACFVKKYKNKVP